MFFVLWEPLISSFQCPLASISVGGGSGISLHHSIYMPYRMLKLAPCYDCHVHTTCTVDIILAGQLSKSLSTTLQPRTSKPSECLETTLRRLKISFFFVPKLIEPWTTLFYYVHAWVCWFSPWQCADMRFLLVHDSIRTAENLKGFFSEMYELFVKVRHDWFLGEEKMSLVHIMQSRQISFCLDDST